MSNADELLDAISSINVKVETVAENVELLVAAASEKSESSEMLDAIASARDEIQELRDALDSLHSDFKMLTDEVESFRDGMLTLSERLQFVGDSLTAVMKLVQPSFKPFVSGITKAGARALIRGLRHRKTPVPSEAVAEIVRTWMPSLERSWIETEIEKAGHGRRPKSRSARTDGSEVA